MQLRVRKHSGRLIGPLEITEFFKLYSAGEIHDLDECQVYPDGTWRNVEEYKNVKNDTDSKSDSILSKLRKSHEPEPEPLENIQVMNVEEMKAREHTNTDIIETRPEDIPDTIDKTIVQKPTEELDHGDRTIVNIDTKKYLEELKKQQLLEEQQRKIEERAKAIEDEKLRAEQSLTTDATSVININELKEELEEQIDLNQVEKELEREAQISEAEREKELAALEEDDEEYEGYDETGEYIIDYEEDLEENIEKDSKRKKRIIMVIGVLLLYLFLADDTENKKKKNLVKSINPINPTIEYPLENEVINAKKSKELYKKGLVFYERFTYQNLLQAAKYFRSSLEHKSENNPARFPLLISYAYNLENSVQKHKDANILFKMLRLVKTKMYLKQDVAIAYSLFYRNLGKYRAALDVLKKYDKVRSTLETGKENYQDIFFWLISDLYLKIGQPAMVESFYKGYTPYAKSRATLLSSFIEYDISKKDYKSAKKLIAKGLKINPDNIAMLLYQAEIMAKDKKYKEMKATLDKIKGLNAGSSNLYFDKYLFLEGVYYYKTEKFDPATVSFRKVFRNKEYEDYRKYIANLNPEGVGDGLETLIKESKAELYIAQTEKAIEELDWNSALTHAINASDLIESYLPAKINLAKVQINQGFFRKALDLLQSYYKLYPQDKRVVFNLVDAYIESFKLYNAKQLLINASSTPLRNSPKFDKLSAKLNIRLNDKLQAVRWLQESINSDPMDDENYYNLAKMLIRLNKHKSARAIISSAIELAPEEIDYRLANAEIIYEQNDPDTAIGYLRQQLDIFPDSAEIEGEIAIYYYKSGQIKNFEETIKALEKKFKRADKLYKFLIQSAALDHRARDVVKYSKQLIKVTPGDLRTRMLLVETLIDLKEFEDALKYLNSIKERLPDYPKLLYYQSTIELVKGNIKKAKELAELEVKKNPGLVDGYLLLGNILKTEGDYFKAEKMFKKAQKILPNSSDAIAGMAYISFKKHQLESAIDLYTKAIKLDTENAILRKELADVYRQNGQNIDAVTQYKIYLELEPDSKYKVEIETYIRQFQ